MPVDEQDRQTERVDAVVVGAGWAGMYMHYRLRELGLVVRTYEAGSGVGGTWFWNRYPGARCDVPSLNYSYSFREDLWQEWEWSERYARQPEIERYANWVADKLEIRDEIRFNTTVSSASFDSSSSTWSIDTEQGARVVAKYCFMATGGYTVPMKPDIPGIDEFRGELHHTARWPGDEITFAGKRVGVIGTGSSGMQTITALAHTGELEHLYVFQRTPNYSIRSGNHPITPDEMREFKKTYADFWVRARDSGSGTIMEGPAGPVRDLPEAEFVKRMDAAWAAGGPSVLNGITDLVFDEVANQRVANYLRAKVRERVDDPAVADLLSPQNAFVGARRQLNEDVYLESYNLPNVSLVDVGTSPITKILPGGIETATDTYDLDAIILATGFDSGTGAVLRVDVTGTDGVKLAQRWADGPRTYLGLMVHGFPNFFVLAGPGSPSIRSNVMMSIEQHVEWLSDLVRFAEDNEMDSVDASLEAEAAWTDHVAATAAATLLMKEDTQYVGVNVPGKPRVYLAYVGGLRAYKAFCNKVAADDYEGFVFGRGGTELDINSRTWSGLLETAAADSSSGSPVI